MNYRCHCKNETDTHFLSTQFEYSMMTTKACKKNNSNLEAIANDFSCMFSALDMTNLLAINLYNKWTSISAVLCSPDLRVCDLFLEPHVKQRLPLVILSSSQSNQPEWWQGRHMVISIIILSMVEQRTLLLLCFSVFVLLCGIFGLYSCKCTQCTNDSERYSLSNVLVFFLFVCVCVCLQWKCMNHNWGAGARVGRVA